jgi:RNA polymerase sigma-70 factor (ECF subfamily)
LNKSLYTQCCKLCSNPFETENSNSEHIKTLKKYMSDIINEELTERQREIVMMYYYENRNISEIADTLSVNPSTISRSLARSRKNIFRILKYYF